MENRYKKIREDYEFTEQGHRMTMEELSDIFKSKGYSSLTYSAIRKIETGARNVSEYELKGYREVFNTTADYLLGFIDEPSRNESKITTSNVTGLNGKSIRTLEVLKQSIDIDTINFIMSDTHLFVLFLSYLRDYIEPGFTIPLHPEQDKNTKNISYVENLDVESDSILANNGRRIYIGKENGEHNGKPLYAHKGILVSELSTLNLLRIQEILQIWKDKFKGRSD